MNIATIDIIVFVSYCVLILAIGLYVSRNKNGKKKIDKWIGIIGLFEQIGKKAWLDSLDRLGRSGHEIE